MIVTIDGPAGAGKSTAAKLLAGRLEFAFLDTGAMYRAVALAGMRQNVALNDETALEGLLKALHLDMPPGRVVLNGEDVADLIRTPDVTSASMPIAASAVVRDKLVAWQRAIATGRNIVTEGRDQGTYVFPDAGCKFFLTASPLERARRRHHELTDRGEPITVEEILRAQSERDARDSARAVAPLKQADDAILIESTDLSLNAVVDRLEAIVRERLAKARLSSPNDGGTR